MAREGPPSFEALYAAQADRLYRFCRRICGDPDDAEDLAQDVLVLAYIGLGQLRDERAAAAWLYRIAVHRWRRVVVQRGPKHMSLAEVGATARHPVGQDQTERLALDRALAALPAELREALILVKAERLTYREAALLIGVPQGTIASRIRLAAARMRALLAEEAAREAAHPPGAGAGVGEEGGQTVALRARE